PIELDVTKDDSIANASKIATDVEILVNNAGIFAMGNFLGGNLLESLKINLDINVWGLVKLTNAFLEILRKQESAAIVSISSVAGLANMPMALTYSVSKAAIHSVVQGLRGELKDSNILIVGVYPGPIETDMSKGLEMEKDSPENVASDIIQGIVEGKEDIFSDVMSKQISQGYSASPKAVEEEFSNFG
ncbi:MAG: SDR family NAD(P)-dependent oxidoreductase, partial [Bacteroidetes bacterium]|nr:SDR family NAD(P)-dependent oxidoreductase [Bacteroidota bacterium]